VSELRLVVESVDLWRKQDERKKVSERDSRMERGREGKNEPRPFSGMAAKGRT